MTAKQTSSEEDLIDRALQGSVDAFEQLVFRYQDRLYRFLLARSGNRSDAEDALQDAFVAAFSHLSTYRSRYRFSTWLFTIARRQLGRPAGRKNNHQAPAESIVCNEPGPEQLGIQDQQKNSLWKTARDCLSEQQFTTLWLFYVEEMPIAEIGGVIKRPVSWVKVNLMRSRRRLLPILQDLDFEFAARRGEVTL